MRYAGWALITAAALLLLATCIAGGGPGSAQRGGAPNTAPGGRGFNATDVMFLQMMIPHHGQGVQVVRLVRERAVHPEVKTLAAAIETTQLDEIKTMTGWLRAWRRPLRAPADAHAMHGGMPETSRVEIEALAEGSDADFERRFLNTMIAHQDDAIQIARMEVSTGMNPRAKDLARRIDLSRSGQIKQMLPYARTVPPQ